jgi:chemotaxis protein methyltransferase CheR
MPPLKEAFNQAMPLRISDQQLSRLSKFVTSWLGLHFPEKRWRDLERIICQAASDLGFQDAAACIEQLVSRQLGKDREDILAGHLTIGETYFFREPKSFEILEERILPDLIASRRGRDQRLRIWSAGCSTGEEAYSLAILLGRLIPDIHGWQITILATDINSRALGKAQRGVYGEWSFRGVPDRVRQRHFQRTADGRFELPHSIRRMVTFAVLNLAEDNYPSLTTNTNAMDVILCRNVLMYFEPNQQERAILGFQRSLLDDGWLIVSPCETSPAFSARFETVMFPGAVFYKKGDPVTKPSCPLLTLSDSSLAGPRASFVQATPPVLPAPAPPRPPRPPAPEGPNRPALPAKPLPYEEALSLYRQGCYGEAAETLSGLLDLTKATGGSAQLFGKAAALLAQSLANRGEIAAALEWTEKAIAVDKLNAELYYLRATILQEQGTFTQAMASLKQALYLDHTFVPAHFALGTLCLGQGRPGEARKHLENALTLLASCPPDDPVPGAEGMTAARLREIIAATRDSLKS